MALRVLLGLLMISSSLAVMGCGDGSIPADPSVSKIGKDDGSDTKIAHRLGKKGNVPDAPAGGQ